MASADPGRGPHGGEASPTLFGLDGEETRAFTDAFAALAEPMGLDGRHIVAALSRGDTLGEALGLPPGFTDLLYSRAHGLFSAGRQDRAEPLFRALCVVDGRTADNWVGYGLCLRQRDEDAQATLAFATAAALRPDWAVPQFHAAQVALAQDRWAEAAAHLDAFRERDGASVPAAMRREAQRQSRALALRAGATGQGAP